MSDDTTTWLKKNPAINPLRRSLKTSMLFHAPNSDMNSSIMSNPDKVKDQGVFIPRMLQRAKMRKSKMHEFKVPEMVVPKAKAKTQASGSGMRKKMPTPNKSKKSLLPVPRTKAPSAEKPAVKGNLPRPSFMPGLSSRGTTARREIIKKIAELSEIKRKEVESSQLKSVAGDSSVLRSILKKRASLRRSSQISTTKPKAKKVLFDGFENSEEEEKENDISLTLGDRSDFNAALDDPTVFLNFPKGLEVEESPFEPPKTLNWSVAETQSTKCDISNIVQLWKSYKENLDSLQSERNSLENSLEALLQHSLDIRKQYQTYKENSLEMYQKLTKLGEELEENLKNAVGENLSEASTASTPKKNKRRSSEKIKMSDKSKAIKKCSGRKIVLKREHLKNVEGSLRTMPGKGV